MIIFIFFIFLHASFETSTKHNSNCSFVTNMLYVVTSLSGVLLCSVCSVPCKLGYKFVISSGCLLALTSLLFVKDSMGSLKIHHLMLADRIHTHPSKGCHTSWCTALDTKHWSENLVWLYHKFSCPLDGC